MANVKSELIKVECFIGGSKIANIKNPFESANQYFKSYDNDYVNYWLPKVKEIQKQLESEGKTTKIVETKIANTSQYRCYLLYDYQFIVNEGTSKECVKEDNERESKAETEALALAKQTQLDKNKQYVSEQIEKKATIYQQINRLNDILDNSTITFNNDETAKLNQERLKFNAFVKALIAKKDALKPKINSATSIEAVSEFDLEEIEKIENVESVESV